jgi:hypothetical protein
MESWCICHLNFECNSHFHCNWPAHTLFSLVLMGYINHPQTPWQVSELAVAWLLRAGWYGIIWSNVHIPWVFQCVSSGVRILVGDICIGHIQHVHLFQTGLVCHLGYNIALSLCHSECCNDQDWVLQ